jgi:hypothetical protein
MSLHRILPRRQIGADCRPIRFWNVAFSLISNAPRPFVPWWYLRCNCRGTAVDAATIAPLSTTSALGRCRRLRNLSITTNTYTQPLLDDTIAHPLSSMSCSNAPLETLKLKGFTFSRDQMTPLLNAMLSCSALVCLVLTGNLEIETHARWPICFANHANLRSASCMSVACAAPMRAAQ